MYFSHTRVGTNHFSDYSRVLEAPLKADPLLLVPSWIASFLKIRCFFGWLVFLNLLFPVNGISQTISPPFRKAVFQKALPVADALLPN